MEGYHEEEKLDRYIYAYDVDDDDDDCDEDDGCNDDDDDEKGFLTSKHTYVRRIDAACKLSHEWP